MVCLLIWPAEFRAKAELSSLYLKHVIDWLQATQHLPWYRHALHSQLAFCTPTNPTTLPFPSWGPLDSLSSLTKKAFLQEQVLTFQDIPLVLSLYWCIIKH